MFDSKVKDPESGGTQSTFFQGAVDLAKEYLPFLLVGGIAGNTFVNVTQSTSQNEINNLLIQEVHSLRKSVDAQEESIKGLEKGLAEWLNTSNLETGIKSK